MVRKNNSVFTYSWKHQSTVASYSKPQTVLLLLLHDGQIEMGSVNKQLADYCETWPWMSSKPEIFHNKKQFNTTTGLKNRKA